MFTSRVQQGSPETQDGDWAVVTVELRNRHWDEGERLIPRIELGPYDASTAANPELAKWEARASEVMATELEEKQVAAHYDWRLVQFEMSSGTGAQWHFVNAVRSAASDVLEQTHGAKREGQEGDQLLWVDPSGTVQGLLSDHFTSN